MPNSVISHSNFFHLCGQQWWWRQWLIRGWKTIWWSWKTPILKNLQGLWPSNRISTYYLSICSLVCCFLNYCVTFNDILLPFLLAFVLSLWHCYDWMHQDPITRQLVDNLLDNFFSIIYSEYGLRVHTGSMELCPYVPPFYSTPASGICILRILILKHFNY